MTTLNIISSLAFHSLNYSANQVPIRLTYWINSLQLMLYLTLAKKVIRDGKLLFIFILFIIGGLLQIKLF